MARSAMRVVVQSLINEVRDNQGLRSLLIASENEDQRPKLVIDGQEYAIGLVDNKPMLLNLKSRDLVNPSIIGNNNVTEIVWRLK